MQSRFYTMIEKIYVIRTDETNPYHNLGLEEALLNRVGKDECILYLWQNRQTVVIGRNQSASAECRIQNLEGDGGFLARRLSGGGAVYHDMGNLNFTFLSPTESFDKEKQTSVILEAVKMSGINAEKNGRNDLTADGRKFSGHAYYHNKDKSYHHGTLMLCVDKTKLSDYLNVSGIKLKSKGVASVRSRVVNLCELKPDLTVEELGKNLVAAFEKVYGLTAEEMREEDIAPDELKILWERYASPEWKYGRETVLPHSAEKRFDWGQVRIDYGLSDGRFTDVRVYSDGLEAEWLSGVADRLKGCSADADGISAALEADIRDGDSVIRAARDISQMICENASEVNL